MITLLLLPHEARSVLLCLQRAGRTKAILRSLRSQSKKAYKMLMEIPLRMATGFFLVNWQYLKASIKL